MNTSRRRFAGKMFCRIAIFFTGSIFVACPALFAQTSDPGQKLVGDSSTGSPAAADSDSVTVSSPKKASDANAALLNELQQMRARIEELEKKLNAQSSGTADPASRQKPPELLDASLTGRAESSVDQQPPAASKGAPAAEKTKPAEPFAFGDWTWLNGNPRTKDIPVDTKFFTPEIRFDLAYIYDFAHPADDTIGGSAEVFRAQEFQLTQLGIGGDFHWENVRGRVMTQVGMYSQTQPRNDASPARGQWTLDGAYRYLAEAYGGYHFDVMHGINVDGGIFLSYIGLFSWYNFDNWAYQPSYVSSNTPFFFNGMRIQFFPTDKLKIEPWFINGWQSYGRFNGRPGLGLSVLWRPNGSVSIVTNNYGIGEDTLGVPGRVRYHTDNSLEVKYYDRPERLLDKMAFSLTGDLGCEHGGGVSCAGTSAKGPKQSFVGYMFYNRFWLHKDLYGVTFGGGQINNPGRYLVLLPPINGATAATGSPYFPENPGDPFKAWDVSATFDYMPRQYITFRAEYDHRAANVPYFSGPGGVTPAGGNTGFPAVIVPGFTPDLRKTQNTINMAIMVKF